MKHIIIAASILCAIFTANIAEAQTRTARDINRTQYNQHKRIQHGLHNGSITRPEARHLNMQQAKVRHYKQMAMADGRVSHRERHMIKKAQQRANHNIYAQKHDRQNRHHRHGYTSRNGGSNDYTKGWGR